MKEYVVILLFSKDAKKVLLVKRKKKPYKDLWNGIGGKLEERETPIDAAIRECKEETGIDIKNPKHFITNKYPLINPVNSGTILHVFYDFVDIVDIAENYEGSYEWKNIEFALDFNNKEIAGCSNLAQFIKEIYDIEDITKFYKKKGGIMKKIVLCGSKRFIPKFFEIAKKLEEMNFDVVIPQEFIVDMDKKEASLLHFSQIEKEDVDALLIVNETKDEKENYIGANGFAELAFGFYKGKKVYLLNDIYTPYEEELVAWNVIPLHGDISRIGE